MAMDDLVRRNEMLVARVRAGETLMAIGKDVGLTRERVRQIVLKAGIKAKRIGKRLPQAVYEFRAWLHADRSCWLLSLGRRCIACNRPILKFWGSHVRITCSAKCHKRHVNENAIRWKDPEYRRKHRLVMARWVWRHRFEDKPYLSPSQIRRAAKLLGKKGPKIKKIHQSEAITRFWAGWRAKRYPDQSPV